MKQLGAFGGQNWLITPAALALNEAGSNWAELDIQNWQPAPFLSETDVLNGNLVGNIFNGVIVNCIVADSHVFISVINYM